MNECVLVVDDDREIVKAIAILLEKEGYQVCRDRKSTRLNSSHQL